MTALVSTVASPSAEADRVVAAVLEDLRHGSDQGVVVDSPPGAGKSTLVVRAALTLAEACGEQVLVVAQTNEQVDDLVHRLAVEAPWMSVGRLSAQDYVPSPRVSQHASVIVRSSIADLRSVAVVVGTAAKWTFVNDGLWQWAIVDEAYQMRSDMLLRIANRFSRALFVGDPGQLDPFSTIDIERWTGLTWDPMQSAVAVLLRHNPDLRQHRLPVSWRLPATAAPVVSEAFYPFAPFVSGTSEEERQLSFRTAGIGGGVVDRVLATAAETGWALYELPARHALRTDAEAADACAAVAVRLLERGAVAVSADRSPEVGAVTPGRIAIGAAHRDQAAAIRAALARRGGPAGITGDHHVLLAVIRGRDLAALYSAHGARLLELNVRSFLQVRGSVNKGILDTLRNRPERFLAYNNGIAATASSVEINEVDGRLTVRRIHNLQIVNGGQTTATIHHAHRGRIDLADVYVQMKLTVVDPDVLDDIVPQISAHSNTQNRVTASDLKANSVFHVDVERIMRTLWAPATVAHPHDTHWFYERARGQYANAIAREGTPARQKIFKAVNPPTQRFTKSDVAKFEHSWAMLPHIVSLGAEKNFVVFSDRLEAEPVGVDKDHCRHLIAKAILFRRVDKIVAKQSFGGYKANIVAYTVAKLVQATGSRIDLNRIWREQDLSPALQHAATDLCGLVQKKITEPPEGRANISEWAKRPECWQAVREITWLVPAKVEAELVDIEDHPAELELARGTAAVDWFDLAAWGAVSCQLTAGECRVVSDIADALASGREPVGKQLRVGVAVMRQARRNGFRSVPGF